jgi:hypothetical protein
MTKLDLFERCKIAELGAKRRFARNAISPKLCPVLGSFGD